MFDASDWFLLSLTFEVWVVTLPLYCSELLMANHWTVSAQKTAQFFLWSCTFIFEKLNAPLTSEGQVDVYTESLINIMDVQHSKTCQEIFVHPFWEYLPLLVLAALVCLLSSLNALVWNCVVEMILFLDYHKFTTIEIFIPTLHLELLHLRKATCDVHSVWNLKTTIWFTCISDWINYNL